MLFRSEIPDWYITDKRTGKVLVGMNQLDLWAGGQQFNRGSKYLNYKTTNKEKLLCVVCNEINFTSNQNKAYKLFQNGFQNDTLCYLGNLTNIITTFFG